MHGVIENPHSRLALVGSLCMRKFIRYAITGEPDEEWQLSPASEFGYRTCVPIDENEYPLIDNFRCFGRNPSYPIIFSALNEVTGAHFLCQEIDFTEFDGICDGQISYL